MNSFLVYLFWPNPGNAGYDSPKVIALMVICILLVVAAFGISMWRRKLQNQLRRKLSRSWATASAWFGFTGLVLIIARVEQIQFLAMRFLWALWLLAAVLYIVFQVRSYRLKYYEVVPATAPSDPRSKYLPKRKRK